MKPDFSQCLGVTAALAFLSLSVGANVTITNAQHEPARVVGTAIDDGAGKMQANLEPNNQETVAPGRMTVSASFQGVSAQIVASVEPPTECEPVTLSVVEVLPSGIRLRSTPLFDSGYQLQSSFELIYWRNEGIAFGPIQQEHVIAYSGEEKQFYRLVCDLSLELALAASEATTLTLNWPPKPDAVAYKLFRDGTNVGSTVGRFGFFTDSGLTPNSTYEYRVEAFDSSNQSGTDGTHFFLLKRAMRSA